MEIVMRSAEFFSLILFIFLFLFSASSGSGNSHSDNCVYTVYVKTGSALKAGTDSTVSMTISDHDGDSVSIPDVTSWGLMGSEHDYFERGNLDVFSGRAPCIGTPICRLNLTSDGSGDHHGWYCDYVEVTATGPHKSCGQTVFYVDRWIASDAPPYELTAIIDGCKLENVRARSGRLFVRNSVRSVSR